ncbi:sensor histidine kinase [Deinococcus ruber]|uniref:histidine kinase n=1 Tax=Deinococcus ruber TaxID=1848197 RepID=A0A918C251_9DEIO|nr:HAMP domain-containing sensor histidine kinase [Deinococcus ruber]GGR02206.1 two-component sensor histidine kinase [Deinococcus ruber]
MKLPAWMHSLRFRLALMYTLLALALVTVVGLVMTVQLLRDLNGQFQARLDERADQLAQAQNNPSEGIGQTQTVPSGSYAMLVDSGGYVQYATAGLQDFMGAQFPFAHQMRAKVGDVPVRVAIRTLKRGGFVWVGLSEDTLIQARQSAMRVLLLALILAPLLTLVLAWLAGRRALRGLGQAAQLAGRINPSHSVAALPLPRRQDEVYELLSAINLLLSRIEAQQAREKQLLGQIVHELGAPLTVLKASLNRAASLNTDPDVRRAALVADELTFTTQDLMQLARGQLELTLAYHYIPARQLRERLDRLVPGTVFVGDWNAFVLCDPDRLTQALRNLLANARRAAGAAGRVELQLQETPLLITFIVQDDGPGLPPELGDRIFAPFVSGAGSSGLGLSVSRQIARMHGGDLMGGNRPEGGAQFILTLPGSDIGDDDTDVEELLEYTEPNTLLPVPRNS